MPAYRPWLERFEEKLDRTDSCWEWQGALAYGGYGVFRCEDGVLRRAHRIAYEYWKEPIPDGLILCHLCDNPRCCRPDHLVPGTKASNMQEASKRGHMNHLNRRRGEHHHKAKLTAADVGEIRSRAAAGETQAALADAYGVSRTTLSRIVRREIWTHI